MEHDQVLSTLRRLLTELNDGIGQRLRRSTGSSAAQVF